MPQGDASQYPVLPISLSIMLFCYVISFLVSILADYVYDFYLVKLSKSDQRQMIENRVKGDFKRLKELLQSQKLEKFNPDEAKNRLTIITNLFMERINSKQLGVIEAVPKFVKETKVEEIKKEAVDVSKLESNQAKDVEINGQSVEKKEKKVSIMESKIPQVKNETEIVDKKKDAPSMSKSSALAPSQIVASNQKSLPPSKSKTQPLENKKEGVMLAQETTIEDIIKKLSLAPRSATVFIEIREAKERQSSPKETKGSAIKFTPPSTIGTVDSDFRLNSDEINSSSNSNSKSSDNKKINYPKQNSDLMEIINRKSALNQNLSKTFRDNQSKMIQERLKLDAEFRKTRHMAPKKNTDNKLNKYNDEDEDEDSDSQKYVTKTVFE